mgnify:FL=1
MNYYYLISSLPVIPEDFNAGISESIEDLFDLIERNLTQKDKEYFRALLYQNDNRNFLNLIFSEYHDFNSYFFRTPSVLSEDDLRSYRRNKSVLPGYMIDFLLDNSGVLGSYSLTDIEMKFRRYFVEYIDNLQSDFIKGYYEWQQHLKSTIAEVNQNKYPALPMADMMQFDFGGARSTYSPIDKELKKEFREMIESHNYIGLEQKVDSLYWDFANEQSEIFNTDAVLAYVIVLLRLSRWEQVTESTDEDFNRLVDDLKKMDRSPKMSVV